MVAQVYARNGGQAEVSLTEVVLLSNPSHPQVLLDIHIANNERDDLSLYLRGTSHNVKFLGPRSPSFAYLNEVLRDKGISYDAEPLRKIKAEPRPSLERVSPDVFSKGLPFVNFDMSGLATTPRVCAAYNEGKWRDEKEIESFDKALAEEMRQIKQKAFSGGRVKSHRLIIVRGHEQAGESKYAADHVSGFVSDMHHAVEMEFLHKEIPAEIL